MTKMTLKDPFIDEILERSKTLEIRINDGDAARVRVGEVIKLFSSKREVRVRVTRIQRFRNFADTVAQISYARVTRLVGSSEELLSALRRIYPRSAEQKGVLVFTIERA